MKLAKYILFLLSSIFFFSCWRTTYVIDFKLNSCDTSLNLDTPRIVRDFGKNWKGSNPMYDLIIPDIDSLGMDRYDKGYDSIALRIWFCYRYDGYDVIDIRKSCKEWLAHSCNIYSDRIEGRRWKLSVSNFRVITEPKSGWEKFTKSLFDSSFTQLPDCMELPNYNVPNDAPASVIEIATSNTYRIFTYSALNLNSDKKEVQIFRNTLDLIETEMKFKPRKPVL